MKVEFLEGFKIVLVAETELERLFMLEWDKRSHIELTDSQDRDCEFIDPAYVSWKAEQ